ncbi:MAG: zonular occludens toxin domain-containing protein [Clostridia bacterium]|nr:zonular occludens toxin domain-containing protein [Clostridia bacterium]
MLHNIFGDVGAGKSAFLMYNIEKLYFERGQEIWDNSRSIIERLNKKRKRKLTPPEKVPIYCNFKFQITNPDGSIYEPYLIKGSEIGIGNKYKKLYPGAVIIIDEAQDEFNSKGDLQRAVSSFFEKHRHADFEIWLASQRPILINKDIRDLSRHFIQIYKLEKTVAHFGIICGLKWHCREFDNRADVDEYVELSKIGKGENVSYRETVYNGTGNILNYFDTKGCLEEYIPEEGADYAS